MWLRLRTCPAADRVTGLDPCSVPLGCCVLEQDNSLALPAGGGHRTWWSRLYGSLASVSLPQGSLGKQQLYYNNQYVNVGEGLNVIGSTLGSFELN